MLALMFVVYVTYARINLIYYQVLFSYASDLGYVFKLTSLGFVVLSGSKVLIACSRKSCKRTSIVLCL